MWVSDRLEKLCAFTHNHISRMDLSTSPKTMGFACRPTDWCFPPAGPNLPKHAPYWCCASVRPSLSSYLTNDEFLIDL